MYTKYICDFSPSSGKKPARQSAHFDLISASLDHLFAELYAAQQMKMQVHHGLTAVLAAVVDNAIAVFQALGLCQSKNLLANSRTLI